ncbi:hypothetical protein [uncultured Aliiroseovarius sp.]|uniref:hypothetical protein n=1 Tax=uncultured Aliiroseovarius sp. TaxID=1658783 RepID=UPI00260CBD3E|nr:hypothetical protein [uncultured Aliiroseovarius sp.]
MSEVDFADLIDCRFPYDDRDAAVALMDQANAISPNASFMVLEELSRPLASEEVTKETRLELIQEWSKRTKHPLASPMAEMALTMAHGKFCSVEKALVRMEQISHFAGLYAGLNIGYFSCDDVDGLVDQANERIRAQWEK